MKKTKYSKISIGQHFGVYYLHVVDGRKWKIGHYVNKVDTIQVYANENRINLSIYYKGIGYYKSIDVKSLPSDLSLSRQASKFSKEVNNETNT